MASQVFSGSGNFSYTNNTGQNVRIIINYFEGNTFSYIVNVSWAGVTTRIPPQGTDSLKFGRNIAFNSTTNSGNNLVGGVGGAPTEIMIAPGQNFAITANTSQSTSAITAYNIVVIPEAG